MKVCVGLSGGVDSTLTALLLKEQGHEVMGVSMSIYNRDIPNLKLSDNSCYGPNEKQEIHLIHDWCQKQGIEHHIVDLSEDFKKTILKYFQTTYLQGKTPNPCVMCNAGVKFGLMVQRARELMDFDYFATGHYAQINRTKQGAVLCRGVDSKKDQSYFLYRLTQDQLKHTLFPLGQYTKSEVRQMAHDRGLIQADQADSQDFYSGDYTDLLPVQPKRGEIILNTGRVLGHHMGFWNYTIGQRKGLGIAYPEPLYVLDLDAKNNRVIVGVKSDTQKLNMRVENVVAGPLFDATQTIQCMVKYRSTGKLVPATITPDSSGIDVAFETAQPSLTPGQSAVFYLGNQVIAGGIIV